MHSIDLEFILDKNQILNANRELHHMAKAKKVSYLRNLASKAGLEWRKNNQDSKIYQQCVARVNYLLDYRQEIKLAKKYKRKTDLNALGAEPKCPVLFDAFKVLLTVCPPTKVRLDPPNLYPTLKPLVDGLTDASFWVDDNYKYMLETSFRYGGLSDVAKHYKLLLHIESSKV